MYIVYLIDNVVTDHNKKNILSKLNPLELCQNICVLTEDIKKTNALAWAFQKINFWESPFGGVYPQTMPKYLLNIYWYQKKLEP